MILIDKDALLKEMDKLCGDCGLTLDIDKCGRCKTFEAIMTVSRSEMVNGWISVKDRMPDDGKDVLVLIPFQNTWIYYVSYVESGKWYVPTMYGRNNVPDITHWMPLPEPPKEE